MALSLTAEQKSIFNIFSGKEQYIIPPYQRPYAWGYKHCQMLLDDLKNAYFHDKDEGYFLGNIVISQNQRDRNSLEVIDGQQRLTTLLLLIKVLLKFDKDNDDLKNAITIQSSRRGEGTQPRLKTMVFMKADNDFLKEALSLDLSEENCKPIEEDSLYKINICYFHEIINIFRNRIDIQDFIDFIMFDTYLLPIVIEGSDPDGARKKALKIYETINDRGLNLSSADILKAKLYSLALNKLQHKDFIAKWKIIEEGCIAAKQSIDSVFETYRLIIMAKEGKVYSPRNINNISFFIEESDSPFNKGNYLEVINSLLRIMESRKVVYEMRTNYYKYSKITVLLQILNFHNKENLDTNVMRIIQIYIFESKNEKKLVFFLEQLVKIMIFNPWIFHNKYKKKYNRSMYNQESYLINIIVSMILKKESIDYKLMSKHFHLRKRPLEYNNNHYILLYSYLDKKNTLACNPYYIHTIYKENINTVKNLIKYSSLLSDENKRSISSVLENFPNNHEAFFYRFYENYNNIGFFVINNFPPENDKDLKKSSISETKEFINSLSGKTYEEVNKIISERTKKIHKVIDKFLS